MKMKITQKQLGILAAISQGSTDKALLRQIFGAEAVSGFRTLSIDKSSELGLTAEGKHCFLNSAGDFVEYDGGLKVIGNPNLSPKAYVLALSLENVKKGDTVLDNSGAYVTVTKVTSSTLSGIKVVKGESVTLHPSAALYTEQAYVPVVVTVLDGMDIAERMVEDKLFCITALANHDTEFKPLKMAVMMSLAGIGDDVNAAQLLAVKVASEEDHLALFLPIILGFNQDVVKGSGELLGLNLKKHATLTEDTLAVLNRIADALEKVGLPVQR